MGDREAWMMPDPFAVLGAPPPPNPEDARVDVDAALAHLSARAREGKLVLLVGAGASAAAGLPVWSRIGQTLKDKLGKTNPGVEDVPQLAGMYVDEAVRRLNDRAAAKSQLLDLIYNQLFQGGGAGPVLGYGTIYPRLARLGVSNFYTTNWDQLLPQCLMGTDAKAVRILDNQRVRFDPAPSDGSARHVVYLHGMVPGAIDEVIATAEDYFQFEARAGNVFQRLLRQLESDVTMLAVGYSFSDLNVCQYLQRALVRGNPGARIYGLIPRTSLERRFTLWKSLNVLPIELDAEGPEVEPWVCAFLDALINRTSGREGAFLPPSPVTPQAEESAEAELARVMERLHQRATSEGLRGVVDWFEDWPGPQGLRPNPPPTHPLLGHVYVERWAGPDVTLREEVLKDLRANRMAGITGLLGIGGVGKTYLAMRIAQDLSAEGWDVAWVSLLTQGTESALDQLAGCFGLRFAADLSVLEKGAALGALFREVKQRGTPTLVVLDNAERFPDLRALLSPLVGVAVLVTSRTEECNQTVRYRTMNSMKLDEALSLCRQYLDNFDHGRFARLTAEDLDDLRRLCAWLGGHPLGIRLVLSGFLKSSRVRRERARPFQAMLAEIRQHGIEAIPCERDPGAGRAGEDIHASVMSTFSWLFDQLEEVAEDLKLAVESGPRARLLLPVLAAVTSIPVQEELVAGVLRELEKIVDLARSARSRATNPEDASAQAARADLQAETGDAGPDVLGLLQSIRRTLGPDDADTTPRSPSEPAPRTDDEGAVPWLGDLAELAERDALRGALEVLVAASLVELEEATGLLRVHPLIREFAFAERRRDAPLAELCVEGAPPTGPLGQKGPLLSAIFQSALKALAGAQAPGERLLDLLPRVRQMRGLAEQACEIVLRQDDYHHFVSGDWLLQRQILEEAVGVASEAELVEQQGRLLSTLGELNDRMEIATGLAQMEEAERLLASLGSTVSAGGARSLWWTRAYLAFQRSDMGGEDQVRALGRLYRAMLADSGMSRHGLDSITLKLAERTLEGPAAVEPGCESCWSTFHVNVVLDAERWLKAAEGVLPDARLDAAIEALEALVEAREARSATSRDRLSPERRITWAATRARIRLRIGAINPATFEYLLDGEVERARRAGIRGFYLQALRSHERWRLALGRRDWAAARAHAEDALRSSVEQHYASPLVGNASARLDVLLARLAAAPPLAELAGLARSLDELWGIAREHGQIALTGWLLLASALLDAHPARRNVFAATRALVQAREAFKARCGVVPAPARVLHRRAVDLLDEDRPVFEDQRDRLMAADRVPPDLAPWRRIGAQLPRRVRSRVDGRTMRLVEGGIHPSPGGGGWWLPSFYVDEEALDARGLRRFLESTGRAAVILCEEPETPVIVPRELAVAYADWAGRALPLLADWHAIRGAGAAAEERHEPDWVVTLDCLLARIRSAIHGEVLPLGAAQAEVEPDPPVAATQDEPLPPIEAPAVSIRASETSNDRLQRFWRGEWLWDGGELEAAFEAGVLSPLRAHAAGLGDERARELALGVATCCGADTARLAMIIGSLSSFEPEHLLELERLFRAHRERQLAREEYGFWDEFRADGTRSALRAALGLTSDVTAPTEVSGEGDERPRASPETIEQVLEHFAGTWYATTPVVRVALEQRVQAPARDLGLDPADAAALAHGLATTISLNEEERRKIFDSIPKLRLEQMHELNRIFREEREKFEALASNHGQQLADLGRTHRAQLVKALIPGAFVVEHTQRTTLNRFHSGHTERGGPAEIVLVGDPLGQAPESELRTETATGALAGVRLVHPVLVAADLANFEPLDEP